MWQFNLGTYLLTKYRSLSTDTDWEDVSIAQWKGHASISSESMIQMHTWYTQSNSASQVAAHHGNPQHHPLKMEHLITELKIWCRCPVQSLLHSARKKRHTHLRKAPFIYKKSRSWDRDTFIFYSHTLSEHSILSLQIRMLLWLR